LTQVPDGCVGDKQPASTDALIGDAARGAAEIAVNHAIFDEDGAPGHDSATSDPDSVQPSADAVEVDVAQTHGLLRVGRGKAVEGDVDAVG
jgi:hypothetical protein